MGLRERGRRASGRALDWLWAPSSEVRCCVMVSRRMGPAVERNRARRWVREALRPRLARAEVPLDVIVWVKRPVKELDFDAVAQDVARWFHDAMERAGARGGRRGD